MRYLNISRNAQAISRGCCRSFVALAFIFSVQSGWAKVWPMSDTWAPIGDVILREVSSGGDTLALRYIRTDDGNTARDFAIDNAVMNGWFFSTNELESKGS